jgi:hypothetical protein
VPYVSQAQRGKFHILEKQGKISHKVVQEFDSASKGLKLPAHVGKRLRSEIRHRMRKG